MGGKTKHLARESAERCIPLGVMNRPERISAFVAGYMAGHAAHTRWANKVISEYREAQTRVIDVRLGALSAGEKP